VRERSLSEGAELIRAAGAALAYPGGPVVISGIDLELAGGQLVIVLGPNGGGKTTLFRGLTGELQPVAGSLDVGADVAYLSQHDGTRLDFPVSVREVVLMGTLARRKLWQRASRRDRADADAALELVGLAELAQGSFGELSGGQRRRVLLARTIVAGSPVLLLDEPLAGVDPSSGEVIKDVLQQLAKDGRLVIVASHDVDHARRADCVVCVNGRVVASGAPDEVLTEPILRDTYAEDLTVLHDESGEPVFAATDCHHDH
jgi:ABC-type Mn2+/Zn2+ transport system ATPase subunit